MNSNTRIFKKTIQFTNVVKNKLFFAKNNLPIKIFLLFSGFLIGSLFGTFLPSLPEQINSYSIIILITIIAIEIVNYLVYSSKKRQFFLSSLFEILLQFFLSIKLVSFFFNRDPPHPERVGQWPKSHRSPLAVTGRARRATTLQSHQAEKDNKKVSFELGFQTMQFKHGSLTPVRGNETRAPIKEKKHPNLKEWGRQGFQTQLNYPRAQDSPLPLPHCPAGNGKGTGQRGLRPIILHSKEGPSFKIKQWQNTNKNFYKNLNSFKIGIMLGFFIDAFKVGS